LQLSDLRILPLGEIQNLYKYKDDYKEMRENMIFVESPDFEELLETIETLL